MPAFLGIVEVAPNAGRSVALKAGMTIGRAADNDIRLQDPFVSRRHAVVWVSGADVGIEDLASRNGVLVDGVRRRGVIRLEPGNLVRIGTFRWVVAPIPAAGVAVASTRRGEARLGTA